MPNLAPQPEEHMPQHEVKEVFKKASNTLELALFEKIGTTEAGERLAKASRMLGHSPMTPYMVQQTEYALRVIAKTAELKDRPEVLELTNALKALHPDATKRVFMLREAAKPTLNVDETRDDFIKNAQPVAEALRKSGREQEATQLEQVAKVIGQAVGTQPQQQPDALKGESVSKVLKNIWDVIEKDPELKKMPQAQNLRKAGQALEGAGLLNITVRDGVIVSFVSNFTNNFSQAQKAGQQPAEKRNPNVVVESPASAVRAPQPTPISKAGPPEQQAVVEKPAVVQPQAAPSVAPAPEEKVASLLSPALRAKAQELAVQNLGNRGATVAPPTAYGRTDIPFDLLAKMGVSAAELEKTGQLQKLLEGQKTDLIPSFTIRNQEGQPVSFPAKLVMTRDAQGVASLNFDLPKHQLQIPKQIQGQEITPGMKEQLEKGGVVFTEANGQAAYLTVDKQMNKVVAVPQADFEVPKVLHGVTLKPEQRLELLEGKPVHVENMLHNNRRIDAVMQLDPQTRTLVARDAKMSVAKDEKQEQQEQQASRQKMKM